MEKEKTQTTHVLSDVKTALDGRTQWSPVLASLVDNLSDTLLLTRLEARQDTVRRKVPAQDDPTKKIDVSVPVRTLKICVCGRDKANSPEAVRKFKRACGPRPRWDRCSIPLPFRRTPRPWTVRRRCSISSTAASSPRSNEGSLWAVGRRRCV